MNHKLFFTLFLTILFFVTMCKQNPETIRGGVLDSNPRPDCESCEILFIGSSYLSYLGNDVVDIFSQLAAEAGKDVYIGTQVVGGRPLSDHLENPSTIDMINFRFWDYVILQGSAAYISKETWHPFIIPTLEGFKHIIKTHTKKTCMVYMMPWAYLDGLTFIDGETETYEQMQTNIYYEVSKLVKNMDIATAPVGWSWYNAHLDGYPNDLYLSDYNHQTKYGAYLAAVTFYSTVFLEEAPQIDLDWQEGDNPEYLNSLAYSIVIDNLDIWNIY